MNDADIPRPKHMRTALGTIAHTAHRDKLSPAQVMAVFENGMLLKWLRLQDAYAATDAPVPENMTAIAVPYPPGNAECCYAPVPSSMDEALQIIERVAVRDKFTPEQLSDLFDDGLLVNYWRLHLAWRQVPANTMRAATETVANGVANA